MATDSYTNTAVMLQTLRAEDVLYNVAHEAAVGFGGVGSWIGQWKTDKWSINRILMVFDHRDIEPQKVITARMKIYPFKWADALGVDYVLQTGLPDFPHYPAIPEDYDRVYYYGNKVAFHDSDVSINATGLSLYIDIDPSWVRLGEFTRLMLRTSDDIAGNPVSNYTQMSILGYGQIFETQPPTLEIIYEVGAIPQPPPNTCPKGWPWWWLLVAAGAGGFIGYQAKKQKEQSRK